MKKFILSLTFIYLTFYLFTIQAKSTSESTIIITTPPVKIINKNSNNNNNSSSSTNNNNKSTVVMPINKGVSTVINITPTNRVKTNIPCESQDSACFIVRDTTQQIINAINAGQGTITEIQSIVAPKFNFELMTAYTVGNSWKKATPTQKKALEYNFSQLLIYTYASALSKFSHAQISISSQQRLTNKTIAVYTQVMLPNAGDGPHQTVKIEYNLTKVSESDSWRAYDIKIENTSLITTYRNQFNEIINSNKSDGINQLIKELANKLHNLQK